MKHSASSLEQWLRCERYWGRERIDGVRSPQGAKASLGERCHSITEAYLRDGTAPNRAEEMVIEQNGSARTYYPGRIVQNIVHHLPPAGTVQRVEEQLDFTYKGLDFTGYIDWQDAATVGDHKFTSSLEYAKSPNDLVKDPQAIIYRTSRWLECDDKQITLQWTYGAFQGRDSRKVTLPVVRDLSWMDSLLPAVERIERAKSDIKDARELPKTGLTWRDPHSGKSACNLFGGCPHLKWCGVSSLERTKVMASAALEKLRALKAAAAAANGSPAPAVEQPKPALVAGAINPPDEQVPPPVDEDEKQDGTPEAPTPAAAEQPTATLKKPRGRPRKDAPSNDNAPTATTNAAVPAVSAAGPIAATTASQTGSEAETSTKIGTLYVNCSGVRGCGPVVQADDFITAAHIVICDEFKIDHYAFLDFGKARGAMAHAVGVLVDGREGSFDVEINTTTQEARDCLQALMQRASRVVRGNAA